jgi:hypothetical protein
MLPEKLSNGTRDQTFKIKQKIYELNPHKIEELGKNIHRTIFSVSKEVLYHVHVNFYKGATNTSKHWRKFLAPPTIRVSFIFNVFRP